MVADGGRMLKFRFVSPRPVARRHLIAGRIDAE